MPVDVDIEVTGVEDFLSMLDHATKVVETTGLVKGLEAAAIVIADELEKNTPVKDEAVPTSEYFHRIAGGDSLDKGLLKASVKYDIIVDSKGRGGYAIISHGKYSYVANFLEYGHRLITHGLESIRRIIGFVAPRPFIRWTAERKAGESVQEFYRAFSGVLIRQGLAEEGEVAEAA